MSTRLSVAGLLIFLPAIAFASTPTPGNAPQLPITGTRIVNVSTEPQLQAAMGNLQAGDTIVIADGTYTLTSTLYINGKNNVTIRGTSGSANVVLVGQGMDNANFGNTEFGIWSNSSNTTIAHLTIRDTYDNCIILNPGAQSVHIYSLTLTNAGSQFVKSNPITNPDGSITGNNNGILEYSIMQYTGNPPGDHGGNGGGYTNGISAHAAQNWTIRGNLFKNFHTPDTDAFLWNPAVLMWNHSANTIVEQNTFVNVDRAIAFGLNEQTTGFDHSGGVIRNNFVYIQPGLLSAARTAGSDGLIIVYDSPNSLVYHNTVISNGNDTYSIEFRFVETSGGEARNNLTDAPIHLRDSAIAVLSGNLASAVPSMFVNPSVADLHLLSTATAAIDKAPALSAVTNDIDGDSRPQGAGYDIGADELVPASTPPSITTVSPLPQGTVGTVYSQNFSATGGASPYSWTVSAGTLPGGLTLSTTGVLNGTPTVQGTFNFTIKVTDVSSATATKVFALTISSSAPVLTTITVAPANITIGVGSTQQFSAQGLDQNGNALSPQPSFSWSVSGGGTVIASGLFTAAASAGGPFTVTATSGAIKGTANVTVSANPPQAPTISTQPLNQTVTVGQTATFNIVASGTAPLSYQWQKSGTNISGATNASYTTPVSTFADNGSTYKCTVTNAGGSATSNAASLSVNRPPVFSSAAGATPNPAAVNLNVSFSVAASDPDGDPLTYAWDFGDAMTASGSSATHTYSAAGTYNVSVTITDGRGGSASSPVIVTVTLNGGIASTVKINFQLASTATPAGYLPDTGLVYGDRGNGYTYGWNADSSANARERNAANSPDKRYDTFIHMQKSTPPNAIWEIALPNGDYSVRIVAGDPSYFDSVYQISAEGVLIVSGTPTPTRKWFEGTQTVTVSDGRLTVSSAAGATNNKINFIEINTLALRDVGSADQIVADPMTITKVSLKMNFSKTKGDSYQVSGNLPALPVSFAPNGATASIDVGAAIVNFTLDKHGHSHGSQGTFSLQHGKKGGSFKALLKSGIWREDWADGGLDNETVNRMSVVIPVTLTINGRVFGGQKTDQYTAHKNKYGISK